MQQVKYIITLVALSFISIATASATESSNIIPVISQRFEYGEMIYRQDNGDIYVLSSSSGQWWLYESGNYSTLASNTNLNAPTDRIAPINGFGRIWTSSTTIQEELGWAVLPEIGFEMDMRFTDTDNIYFTRLNGIRLHLRQGGTWRVLSDSSDTNALINYFDLSETTIISGEILTITYDAIGSDFLQLIVVDASNPNTGAIAHFELTDFTSTIDWVVPEILDGNYEVILNLVNYVRASDNNNQCYGCLNHLESESILINVIQSSEFNNETYAAFQQYSNGFMIWREDSGAVQIFYSTTGTWQAIPENVYRLNSDYADDVPENCIVPVNAFAKVWHSYPNIQDELGCAVDSEIGYTLSISGDGLGNFTYSLPDESFIDLNATFWE